MEHTDVGLTEPLGTIKEINQLAILNLLRLQPGLSRSTIARETGLGKATVSSLVTDLIRSGLVCEVGRGVQKSSAGRRPIRLELERQTHLAIGVELTGNEYIAVLTDLYARPLASLRWPMPLRGAEASVDKIARAIGQLLQRHESAQLLGVAVGVPGSVDRARQRVIMAENIGWTDVPLSAMLQERIHKPVLVVKRNNAGALGEYWYGAGKGVQNLVYVSLNIGVGAGMILQGRLYEGENGSAGEIGHMTVDPNGYRCKCGNMGCLETLASTAAILVRAKQRIRQGEQSLLSTWAAGNLELITWRWIADAACQGDGLATQVVAEAGRAFGIVAASLVNLFNPALIILDGELPELGQIFLEPVRQTVNQRAFSLPLSSVRIVPSALGHQAAAIGAAALIIDDFFSPANWHPEDIAGLREWERDSSHTCPPPDPVLPTPSNLEAADIGGRP